MNTTQLKRFAAEARNKLREGVKGRLIRLGFDLKTGEVPENLRPVAVENAGVWRGKAVSNNFMYNWNELYNDIKQIGIKQMIEEGAYTWFNRFVAIRILAKNNLCDAVLQYVDSARTPRIVDEARTGRIPAMSDEQRQHLDELLDDDRLVTEQFAVLINAWVNNNPIISTCFDADSKHFMELLLPDDILSENGFISMLNGLEDKPAGELLNTKYQILNTDDYRSPELIGWLYQFYISERKDEVFAKKGKYDADEIAPATQIFTPNWIVKYMVQNTVGRIYLDSLPESSKNEILNTKYFNWKYLVEPSDSEKDQILNTKHEIPLELEQLKVADLACGSGHILNECFDLLYELYIHEGYSRREAVTNIFEHNLTGIDIDLRAKQLATFALLLKACQRDSSFADAHCLPHVYDMPKVDRYTFRDTAGHFDCAYQITHDNHEKAHKELDAAFTLMENADTLGSIMKFDISPKTREYLVKAVDCFHRDPKYASSFSALIDGYKIILALTQEYDTIALNPPYMGGGNMNTTLSNYVKANYPNGKADLATVFVEMLPDRVKSGGKYGFIIPPSWMFLPSFEGLRRYIISSQFINSFIQLSNGAFGGDFGSTPCIITNCTPDGKTGIYFRIVNKTFQFIDSENLRQIFIHSLKNKEIKFDFVNYESGDISNLFNDNGNKIVFDGINQLRFLNISSAPLAYWISENVFSIFNNETLNEFTISDGQTKTGNNNKFLRFLWEISKKSIGINNKWVKHPKGGAYRRWYGNIEWVVDWSIEARDFYRKDRVARILPEYLWWRKGISWTLLTSGLQGYREYPDDCIFNLAAPTLFFNNENDRLYAIGLLNTPISVMLLNVFNPTINNNIGDIQSIPFIIKDQNFINEIVSQNISISKADWDAHETSWDFQVNEIIRIVKEVGPAMAAWEDEPMRPLPMRIGTYVNRYKSLWEGRFFKLHANEEELNRRFIEIYGLQDELTPDVPLNEVTILQQGEISIWKEGDPIPREVKNGNVEFSPIVWHDDVLMKQLISYAVGCMMGRYRLDRPGLAVAHPDATAEEIAPYPIPNTKYQTPNTPNAPNTKYQTPNTVEDRFDIDDDAIIPLMPADCGFYDNATQRMSDFVRQVFGADTQTENLNYIERCLGKSIEQYFIKDFWKDHKKMYQNRPIYWLFSSKKGAFQVITYMHRMTPYTVERIRAKYLLPYIETLGSRIAELQSREDALSTAESKLLDSLQKQLEECREYHDRLAVVAERAIGFDLDDGVLHNYALYGDILAKLK